MGAGIYMRELRAHFSQCAIFSSLPGKKNVFDVKDKLELIFIIFICLYDVKLHKYCNYFFSYSFGYFCMNKSKFVLEDKLKRK